MTDQPGNAELQRSSDHEDDGALAQEAAQGCRRALGALFSRHRDAVYGVAFRITGTRQDAEDVLQEVFVGLPMALTRYRERGRFTAWLRQVAARVALSRVRASGRHTFEALEAADGHSADRRHGPDDVVDRLVLQEALAAMPQDQRMVFLLKEVDGFRHDEIAELLSISAGNSRTRLHRAWSFLHQRVGGDW